MKKLIKKLIEDIRKEMETVPTAEAMAELTKTCELI